MNISAARAAQLAALITLHAMAATMVVFVLGLPRAAQPWRWPELAIALVGSLVLDRLLERCSRHLRSSIWTATGLVVIVLFSKRLLGGGLNPLTGWQVLLGAERDVQGLIFSTGALLWAWGCGPRLPLIDHQQITGFFQRTIVVTLLLLAFQGMTVGIGRSSPQVVAMFTAYIVVFFGSGLLALALSNVDTSGERTARRWTLSLVLPVGAVILSGIVVATLLSPTLRQAVAILVAGALLAVGVVLAPLAVLLTPLAELLRGVLLRLSKLAETLLNISPFPQNAQDPTPPRLVGLPAWMLPLLQVVLLVLLCLAVLVVLHRLARRARPQAVHPDEERDSVWSWDAFQRDLLGLLKGVFGSQQQQNGLLAALAALRGADTATRVRRAYVRLLLFAEAREHGRAPSQTPREYEPTARQLAPHAQSSIEQLTSSYEQARYGSPPSAEQAAAAEQALREIEQRNRR